MSRPRPRPQRSFSQTLQPIPEGSALASRRATVIVPPSNIGKSQPARTSKSSQKLVLLPIEAQEAPFPDVRDDALSTTHKSEGERMSKRQRELAGFKRLTAYCVAESFRMKLLATFLKREHGVTPRIYDEAMYVLYHLPLLPGYQENIKVRSSTPPKTAGFTSMLTRMSEAEESGYEGTYFPPADDSSPSFSLQDGYISSSPPTVRNPRPVPPSPPPQREIRDNVAEVVIFQYGVVVFFGLEERQERNILEDLQTAGGWVKRKEEDDWEVEACHYVYDPTAPSPRIYNDFFTLKSHSHLLKLSISHALAQSTLLARFESTAQVVLSQPSTMSIPRQLASTGKLNLRRRDALRLTGLLFKLRRDVNLVSNILDVPEFFWSEASLKDLYDAVRDYMEITPRVEVLNEKLGVANDLLDIIHEHLNGTAMTRITMIIIWLIVVACLVELGEVLARLVVHAGERDSIHRVSRGALRRMLTNR